MCRKIAAWTRRPGQALSARTARRAPTRARPNSTPSPATSSSPPDARRTLRQEIDALDKDRATLNQSLIDGGREVQKLEGEIDAAEGRLGAILDNEEKLRASLSERRGVLAEVLAALQRMGHRPPPALLVRPDDALASIRSAILLGAVVPDFASPPRPSPTTSNSSWRCARPRSTERDRLRADATALAEGRARIALLIEESANQRAGLGRRAGRTSRSAPGSLPTRRPASATSSPAWKPRTPRPPRPRPSRKARRSCQRGRQGGDRPPTSLGSADRLAPAVAFADAKGLLPLPANGTEIKAFGADDGLGGRSQGVSLATRDGAQVSSPTDGWVVYAGPFRSYGQLLIINAGDGYHVLLAGMERIDVQLGQFVLAGEPVAVMASQKLASAGAVNIGVTQPVLYIEFRKDGASIDPAPWWAASNVEKVGG